MWEDAKNATKMDTSIFNLLIFCLLTRLHVQKGMKSAERRRNYQCDITYTNNSVGDLFPLAVYFGFCCLYLQIWIYWSAIYSLWLKVGCFFFVILAFTHMWTCKICVLEQSIPLQLPWMLESSECSAWAISWTVTTFLMTCTLGCLCLTQIMFSGTWLWLFEG